MSKMLKLLLVLYVIVITVVYCVCTGSTVSNNNSGIVDTSLHRFPGFNKEQMEQLLLAKEQYCIPSNLDSSEKATLEKSTKGKCCIPLPTWLPQGFAVRSVKVQIGKNVDPDSMQLSIVYSKKAVSGKIQVFVIEAGFEFGDIPYSDPYIINSSAGKINLFYEPVEDSEKLKRYVMTDWFGCHDAGYPQYTYNSTAEFLRGKYLSAVDSFEMISLDDTKKILGSMEQL